MKKQSNNTAFSPSYPNASIRSLSALSKALGIHQDILIKYAHRANQLYRLAAQEKKPDGSIRQTFDAYPALKAIQIRIKERILRVVEYPPYLQGSLRGCSPRTNAAIHVKAKICFAEDIANFFPSANYSLIKNIWSGFFGFPDDVAELLTILSVKDDGLPQGAVTSSYLANLVFWNYEPNLVNRFKQRGLIYSRYVDDISVSSKYRLTIEEQSRLVSDVYGMLLHHGFQPKRAKHEVFTAGKSMRTTKLLNNTKVALPVKLRQNIRAAVFALEKCIASGLYDEEVKSELSRVASRVGRLRSFHATEGAALRKRLSILRQTLDSAIVRDIAQATPITQKLVENIELIPPWE